MMTAAAMISCGLGVMILPGSAREREAFSNLCSRPIEDDAFLRPISLVQKQRHTLSPACNRYVAERRLRSGSVADVRRRHDLECTEHHHFEDSTGTQPTQGPDVGVVVMPGSKLRLFTNDQVSGVLSFDRMSP
jgi:hypothetical protein